MKLLATLLLACALPAQASLYNLTIPVGVQATVIDWQGKPSLCLVRWGPGAMFVLRNPAWWYPQQPPMVELTVAGVGVWDFRPCSAGGTYWLGPDYENQFLACQAGGGLYIKTSWTTPVIINGRMMTNSNYDFRSVKCPNTVWIRTTTCQDEFPEGACLVLGLAVK